MDLAELGFFVVIARSWQACSFDYSALKLTALDLVSSC
jgi:hypothetical protein